MSRLMIAGNPTENVTSKEPIWVYQNGKWVSYQRGSKECPDFPIVSKMTITPEWADKILAERNKENRDEKPTYQDRLVQSMRSNRFYTTNQGIGFYEDGQLADGQNRLRAVVRSGVSVRMFVVFGISPDAKPAIDDGVKRTDTDIRRIIYRDRETPKRVIMIANTLISMMRNGIQYPNKFEKQDFYDAYMEAFQFTFDAFKGIKRKGITQMSVLAAVARAYYHCDHDRLRSFVRVLNEGIPEDPQGDRAAIKLRNLLLDEKAGGLGKSKLNTGYGREEVYRKTERAIAHFMRREPIDKLYEAREEIFPLPHENDFFGRLTRDEEAEDYGKNPQ